MIKETEYKYRRDKVIKQLSKNSIAVVFSSEFKTRSNDTQYQYRQNSNFYYLTGFKEDNSALVFLKRKKSIKTILFVQKKDEKIELWHGKRLGEKEAKKNFQVDEIFTIDKLDSKLKEFSKTKNILYIDLELKDKRVKRLKKSLEHISNYKISCRNKANSKSNRYN